MWSLHGVKTRYKTPVRKRVSLYNILHDDAPPHVSRGALCSAKVAGGYEKRRAPFHHNILKYFHDQIDNFIHLEWRVVLGKMYYVCAYLRRWKYGERWLWNFRFVSVARDNKKKKPFSDGGGQRLLLKRVLVTIVNVGIALKWKECIYLVFLLEILKRIGDAE